MLDLKKSKFDHYLSSSRKGDIFSSISHAICVNILIHLTYLSPRLIIIDQYFIQSVLIYIYPSLPTSWLTVVSYLAIIPLDSIFSFMKSIF